jgi:hypothetical protein
MILSFRALWSLSTRRGAFPAVPKSEQHTTWKVKDEKAKNNTKGQRNKGSNEPQGSVFPYFAPLVLCPFLLKKLSSP